MLTINYSNEIKIEFPEYIKSDVDWYINSEINTKKYYLETINKNFNIIDAGAQIGMYSVLFSKFCNHVYAFEPTDTVEKLKKNLEYNKCDNVSVINKALGNFSGIKKDKIYKIWSQNIVDDKEFEFITIDDFIESQNLKIDLIKIDVDSYEYEVLQGMKNTLANISPIIVIEITDAIKLKHNNLCVEDVKNYILSYGYSIKHSFPEQNYVFCK